MTNLNPKWFLLPLLLLTAVYVYGLQEGSFLKSGTLAQVGGPYGSVSINLTLVGAAESPLYPNRDIMPLNNGTVIDVALTGSLLSVVARTSPSAGVGSIKFELPWQSRHHYEIDGRPPWALVSHRDEEPPYNYYPMSAPEGTHTLTVRAYSGPNGTGLELGSTRVTFTIVGGDVAPPDQGEWLGFDSMEIQAVEQNANEIVVTTTGAKFVFTPSANPATAKLFSLINPRTNDYYLPGTERQVAELSFAGGLGAFQAERAGEFGSTILDFAKASLEFNPESFLVINANQPLTYTHQNLVTPAPWDKQSADGADHIWTDGYGGSLHAKLSLETAPIAQIQDQNTTRLILAAGDQAGHMVFPPKQFDFEGLYGVGERPLAKLIGVTEDGDNLAWMLDYRDQGYLDDLKAAGVGTLVLWAQIYTGQQGPDAGTAPVPIKLNGEWAIGYRVKSSVEPILRRFIDEAQRVDGFKVLFYSVLPGDNFWTFPGMRENFPVEGVEGVSYQSLLALNPQGERQDIETTLEFMRQFRADYGFDGWYFDNADAGSLADDLYFIKSIRQDIGPEGKIFHHDSVDVWDLWEPFTQNPVTGGYGQGLPYTGLKAVMVDAYVDYTVTGETGIELAGANDPNQPYLRFFASGYGLSQAWASQLPLSGGQTAISLQEKNRVMAENLNGAEWHIDENEWRTHFKPFFDQRRREYQSGNFNPDVSWPLNGLNSWFRAPTNVSVTNISSRSVRVNWHTSEPASSEVAYTSDGLWWTPLFNPNNVVGPDGTVSNLALKTNHQITLTNLQPNTEYQYRIRSRRGSDLGEILWGEVGNFRTD